MATLQSFTPNLFYGKDGEDAISHFYNYCDWLDELVRQSAEAAPVRQEANQIQMFKLTLRGEARKWIENLNFTTSARLKTSFIDKFGKEPSREQNIEEMAKSKLEPNETVTKYADRITQTGVRLGFQEDLTKDWFVNGLPLQMKLYITGASPDTFADTVNKAKEYERLCKSKAEPLASIVQPSAQEEESASLLQELRQLVLIGKRTNNSRNQRQRSYDSSSRSREPTPDISRSVNFAHSISRGRESRPNRRSKRPRSYSREPSRSPRRDYTQSGRAESESPRRSESKQPDDTSKMACWMCGKIGHFYKNCRHDRFMPFQSKMQMEGMKKFLSNIEHFSQNSG